MYAVPTCPTCGAVLAMYAPNHACQALSAHIGSGPGVFGLSGIHSQPFVPARSSVIEPSAPISMIVALEATASGAALMAFAIFPSGVLTLGAASWGMSAVRAVAAGSASEPASGSAHAAVASNSVKTGYACLLYTS